MKTPPQVEGAVTQESWRPLQRGTNADNCILKGYHRKVTRDESMEKGELNGGFQGDTETPKRKVSINSDPVQAEKTRKISSTSSLGRPKSILVHSDSLSHHSCICNGVPEQCRAPVHTIEETRSLGPAPYDHMANSWWFVLCTKCRQKETGPGWEPPFWQGVCPYPFCPTYRHTARVFALFLLGFLAWGVVYCIIGEDAAPGGQLFDIAVLCIAANFGGWIISRFTMPPLVGMLLVGIIWQNTNLINIHGKYIAVVGELRKIALVIILTRAGLDLDAEAMKRLKWTVLKMGLIPWLIECFVVFLMAHFLLGLPWMWGLLLGSIVAAVSPAVVVPCLIRLRNKGYGVAKGIPTLIIAVSGIDDAASVAAFGIISSLMFAPSSLAFEILVGPLSILVGIGFGILWGALAKFVPEKEDPFVVPLRIILLLMGGLIAVMGSEHVGISGAGPLGVVAAAFFSVCVWTSQGWDVEDNPVATAFEIFWMIFEPVLFGLTGTQIDASKMDPNIVSIGIGILFTGIVLRIIVTMIVGFGASLNFKEKLCCSLAWMSKASVQAALGPVALDVVRGTKDEGHAKVLMIICIMSIILTAPTGAIIITLFGKKLLTKTSSRAPTPEGWRRSARPSLRDISIFHEEDEDQSNIPKSETVPSI